MKQVKLVQINGGVFGSTGKIMFGIEKAAKENGFETLCFSPVTASNKDKEPDNNYIKIGNFFSRRISVLLGRITGYSGCFAPFATLKMLKKIKEFKPGVIQLHNLHDSYVNLPMLFKFIKKHNIKTVWSLHDCWSFTGHCYHFQVAGCDKWKSGCFGCPQYKEYPSSVFDNSKKMYRLKKKWFTGIKDLTIVASSKWMANLLSESFLKEYPVAFINNGIDLDVFKYTPSSFREEYSIAKDKKILLGISFGWGYKKGLDVFCSLAETLDKDKYQIVLVGTDENTDKVLPNNIISIHTTNSQKELAQIYSAADLFVNPTREDTFPTVNIEAIACGLPVATTANTGGGSEIIDSSCGITFNSEDVEALIEIIESFDYSKAKKDAAIKRAENYNKEIKFKEYVKLFVQ